MENVDKSQNNPNHLNDSQNKSSKAQTSKMISKCSINASAKKKHYWFYPVSHDYNLIGLWVSFCEKYQIEQELAKINWHKAIMKAPIQSPAKRK